MINCPPENFSLGFLHFGAYLWAKKFEKSQKMHIFVRGQFDKLPAPFKNKFFHNSNVFSFVFFS